MWMLVGVVRRSELRGLLEDWAGYSGLDLERSVRGAYIDQDWMEVHAGWKPGVGMRWGTLQYMNYYCLGYMCF